MKLLFALAGIQDSQKQNLILFTIPCPIQMHIGRINTHWERGYSILPIPDLIALISHNNLPKQTITYRPLLRLDQTVHSKVVILFSLWRDATTQKRGSPYHLIFLNN
jgi:hypothetical protein